MDPPDVVVLDLKLPVLSGWEVVARMRESTALARTPIIVMSGAADRAPPQVDRSFSKPIDPREIVTAVRSLIGQELVGDGFPLTRELQRSHLELAELRRFRDEMSTMIAHDLRNPLASALIAIDWLRSGRPGTRGEEEEALLDARDSILRALSLAQDLTHVARLETGVLTPARQRILLESVVADVARLSSRRASERTVQIETRLGDRTEVSGDADLIRRVAENLVDNAIRHTPRGGSIRIEIGGDTAHARILVGNSGKAIPHESRSRIFEKYAQLSPGGPHVGLGLYFCRLVAEVHGGRIWVEEHPDFPATFVVELPRDEAHGSLQP
jgi:signal transduction histidine kinase